ncbi:hypothetical protein [Nocardia sp. alder85J]|uniref:hypothetical protein n=1 Tax=Nocardia sp. alder85J TaxID=2862949 RepID=UPI001CD43B0E|nr:hypothetical protein [Nocardia sp. alder85J]MCX4098437.1 hypothetical protein [Nocardia sp. alder85J]
MAQNHSRPGTWRRWSAGAVLAMAFAAAGCATSTTPGVPDTGTTAPAAETPDVSADSAKQLCDMIGPQVDTWRGDGPTLGKTKLNATVHDWALRNNGVNVAVMRNRAVVDEITTAHCPDVRQAAIAALQIPDLASGLAGI